MFYCYTTFRICFPLLLAFFHPHSSCAPPRVRFLSSLSLPSLPFSCVLYSLLCRLISGLFNYLLLDSKVSDNLW